jgi:ribose transport system permease protein
MHSNEFATEAVPEHEHRETRPRMMHGIGRRLIGIQEAALLLLVVGLVLLLTVASPLFMTQRNIVTLLSQISMTGIAAFALSALMIAGEIDLSIGSLQAFVGVVTMLALNSSHSFIIGIGTGLSAGALVGLLNGSLVLSLRISSFIVTLAMLYILRGVTFLVSNASVQNVHHIPAFGQIGNGFIGPVPWPVALAALVFVVFYLILNRTVLGRHIFATGGNRQAAVMAGIRASRVKLLCFVCTGVAAALSAIILVSRMNSGEPKVGQGFEVQTLAAVLLGGTGLSGGEGSLAGTLLAVLLLGILSNGTVLLNINSSWQTAAVGMVILLAIWLDARRRRGSETTRV